jgi:hypothetical protein
MFSEQVNTCVYCVYSDWQRAALPTGLSSRLGRGQFCLLSASCGPHNLSYGQLTAHTQVLLICPHGALLSWLSFGGLVVTVPGC